MLDKNKTGFVKDGQTKVSQNPKQGLKKLADAEEEEYGVDDLVNDSIEEEDEDDNSNTD